MTQLTLNYQVEFHEAIAGTIPFLIKWFGDGYVRSRTVELIGKLAKHGEERLRSIGAQLTGLQS